MKLGEFDVPYLTYWPSPWLSVPMLILPQSWIDHDRAIKPYLWRHRIVGICSRLISILGLFILVWSRAWLELYEKLGSFATQDGLFHVLLYFGALGILFECLSFPFQWLSYRIERNYKLSKQSFGSWLLDLVKGLCVGVVIGAIALSFLYGCYRGMGTLWWLAAAFAFIGLTIILAQLAPVLLIPIFYKLSPMDSSPLKTRLLELCQKFKIEVKEVYHLGLGEKTEKGNAAFVGLGKTKRIIIGDTFYQKYSPDEVEAVFAHELGHQIHDDLWKGIGLSAALSLFVFFVSNLALLNLAKWSPGVIQGTGPTLATYFVIIGIVQIPLNFIQANFSRWRERLADQFAADIIGSAQHLAASLEKLTIQNKGQFKPNPVIEFFTYSHPAPWRRILTLRGKQ